MVKWMRLGCSTSVGAAHPAGGFVSEGNAPANASPNAWAEGPSEAKKCLRIGSRVIRSVPSESRTNQGRSNRFAGASGMQFRMRVTV